MWPSVGGNKSNESRREKVREGNKGEYFRYRGLDAWCGREIKEKNRGDEEEGGLLSNREKSKGKKLKRLADGYHFYTHRL